MHALDFSKTGLNTEREATCIGTLIDRLKIVHNIKFNIKNSILET